MKLSIPAWLKSGGTREDMIPGTKGICYGALYGRAEELVGRNRSLLMPGYIFVQMERTMGASQDPHPWLGREGDGRGKVLTQLLK